jgi:hypothetical protein
MFHIASGSACIHPKFRVASQTAKGSGQTLSNSGGTNSTTYTPVYYISLDLEKMNWVERRTVVSDGISVEQDTIMNWQTGILAQRIVQGNTSLQCKISEFPWVIRGLDKLITKMILGRVYGLFKCVGHHDDLDEYESRIALHPRVVPASLDMNAQFDLDAAGVFKKTSTYSRIISATNNLLTIENMTFTEARPGGPSEEDLKVPEAWKCSQSPSREAKDVLVDWLGPDSPFQGHMRIIPYALAAVMSEADSAFVV